MQFVDLPETVTNIKENAFYGQDLNFEEFTVPSTWVEVSSNAFYGAYFKKLTLTNMNKESDNIVWNGITTPYVEMNGMGKWQMNYRDKGFFAYSNIKHVNYGDSKIKLNKYSFSGVNEKFRINNLVYKTFKITWDGQKTDADFDIPEWEINIPRGVFVNCDALQSVTFKDLPALQNVGGYVWGSDEFRDCDTLQSATFENLPNLQRVGANTFKNCGALKSITFENLPKLQSIGDNAFEDCYSIQSVTFKNLPAFREVGKAAFKNCDRLQNIFFKNLPALHDVGRYTFYNCDAIQNAIFKNLPNFQFIGENTFYNCNALKSVTFENLPIFLGIGKSAFKNCKSLTDVTFKDTYIRNISQEAFANTSLKNLKFIAPKEKGYIPLEVGIDAFRNCNIIRLELPKRYNLDDGSGFINQKFTRTLTTADFKNDPSYRLVRNEGDNSSYVTITNPISIKHGDNKAYLGSVEANPYVEIIDGPNGEPNMIMKIKGNTALGETYNATWSNNKLQIDNVAGKKDISHLLVQLA